jgi:N-acetylneuraminic acid mutarotase
MAGQAIGAGSTGRRVLFGLLDAGGWTWASLKAAFWFVVIVLMLGYLPDRAYYFTVFPTIDLGVMLYSPINFCPPTNRTVPCPPPTGSTLPWDASPAQLALPGPRTDGTAVQVGSKLMYVGGSDGTNPTATTFVTPLYSGNFGPWLNGPALPAARTGAATAVFGNAVYVAGGSGPDGEPTDTVYVAAQDLNTGEIGAFAADDTLKLPAPRAGAAIVAAGDGLFLIGGTDRLAPQPTVWKAALDTKTGKLTAWKAQQSLPSGLMQTAAALVGDFVYVYGGQGVNAPTNAVLRGDVSKAKETLGQIVAWESPTSATANTINLPAPRARAGSFSANGVLYLVGGQDGSGLHPELYWTVPDAKGDIPGWKHQAQTDLPTGVAGTSAAVSGSDVFLVGGTTANQAAVVGSARANLAPQPPFFQLGLFGVVVPALKIGGEIGQQLGYLNAAGVATVDFILLLLVGWAFAHPARARAILARVFRRERS